METTTITIMQTHEGDDFYLNHSCMNTLSFGSADMAWTTDDRQKAYLMLDKCREAHPDKDIYIADY